jgi:(p)ppGpp synthase/HD superfamily hydrolase
MSYKVGSALGFHDYDANFKFEVLSFIQISWVTAIREWQEEYVGNRNCREFVETITRDLLGGCVFVFSPRGEVKLCINLH